MKTQPKEAEVAVLAAEAGDHTHNSNTRSEAVKTQPKEAEVAVLAAEALERHAQHQLQKRADLVGGRALFMGSGEPRIYLPSRRDTAVYVSYPDFPTGSDDLLGGPKLEVKIAECGQHAKWYEAEQRKALSKHRLAILALAILSDGDASLAHELIDDEPDLTDEIVDAAMQHSANGRFSEAREVLGLRRAE